MATADSFNRLSLARDPAVDADVIVSSDHHLLELGPAWNGRLIMRPGDFVKRVLKSQQRAPQQSPLDRFPELRGIDVDPTSGLTFGQAPPSSDLSL